MNSKVQNDSLTDLLRSHVERARKQRGVSKESLAYDVAIAAKNHWNNEFNLSGDAYYDAGKARQKLYRWLNGDVHLPADMLAVILSVLTKSECQEFLDEYLSAFGLATRVTNAETKINAVGVLFRIGLKETNEANQAFFDLLNCAREESLLLAHKEVNEAIAAMCAQRDHIEAQMEKLRSAENAN